MIVTLTLNPAIDKTTEVERLVPEKKMRCSPLLIDAGGGGINVSKAVQELGGESVAVYASGGLTGQRLTQLLQAESIAVKPVPIEGETRENFAATELATNKQFRFVLPGPSLTAAELEAVTETALTVPGVQYLVCSGSLPPGAPVDYLAHLADAAKQRGVRFVVDTSGPALQAALQKGVYLAKPNMTELCSLAGKDHLDQEEIEDAAQEVIAKGGCEVMVVSMGPTGALLATKDGCRQFAAPSVKKQTTVGAGDSMVAGLVWWLQSGQSLEEAVRFGIACGTAATINKGTQLFTKADALRLYEWMKRGRSAAAV